MTEHKNKNKSKSKNSNRNNKKKTMTCFSVTPCVILFKSILLTILFMILARPASTEDIMNHYNNPSYFTKKWLIGSLIFFLIVFIVAAPWKPQRICAIHS